MDENIARQTGNLQEYIRENGWEKFRKIENSLLNTLNIDRHIIDCGGGIIEFPGSIDEIKKKGYVFWLKVSPGIIKKRLSGDRKRLSLSGINYMDEISIQLKKRSPLYQKCADFIIDADFLSPGECADKIIKILHKNNILQ